MAAPNLYNVSSIYGKTMGETLGITSNTNILTCPSNKVLKINSIYLVGIDTENSVTASVNFYDNSEATRVSLAKEVGIPQRSTLVVVVKDSGIYLEESDRIEAFSLNPNTVDIVISYEELDDA